MTEDSIESLRAQLQRAAKMSLPRYLQNTEDEVNKARDEACGRLYKKSYTELDIEQLRLVIHKLDLLF